MVNIRIGSYMATPLMPKMPNFAQHRFGHRQASVWEVDNVQIAPFSVEDIM